MAEFEQTVHVLAEFERQKAPCQVLQLAEHREVKVAVPLEFCVQAYVDDHVLSATAETAKDAFAKAIEWRVVGRLADVSISDGTRSYSIIEFSSVMALAEMANTIANDANDVEEMPRRTR